MNNETTYDLIIIGGGPAGVAAGVYAARKKMKTLLVTETFGGQSSVSGDIQNWIGTKSISGYDLAKSLEEHLRAQEDIDIVDDDLAARVTKAADGGFEVATRDGKTYATKFLLIASGSSRRKLGIPGEKEFDGKGVVYCSTCDAPLFKGKTVAVVGGGNSALESVIDLFPYAAKTYLIVRGDALKGDPVTQEKIKTHPNVEIMFGTVPQEITGSNVVMGLKVTNKAGENAPAGEAGEAKELALQGVFVEIGLVPNSGFVKDLVALDTYAQIIVDPRTQLTSCPGIWAAGDVTNVLYRQNNISVGDAVKAVLNIYEAYHGKSQG